MIQEALGQTTTKPAVDMAKPPQMLEVSLQIAEMRKVMLEMAGSFKKGMNEMARKVDQLTHENQALRSHVLRLMLRKTEPVKVIPWVPPVAKDPLASMTWWRRIWVQLMTPEILRQE